MFQRLCHVRKNGIDSNGVGVVIDGTLDSGKNYVWDINLAEQAEYWKNVFCTYSDNNLMIRLPETLFRNMQYHDVPLTFDGWMTKLIFAAEKCDRQEIMFLFPVSGIAPEKFTYLLSIFDSIVADSTVLCRIGVEISDPQTALLSEEYAEAVDFIVFQTEELTKAMYQMASGDARSAVCEYMRDGIFEQSPFCSFDSVGLGTLLLLAMCRASAAKPGITFGVEGKPIEEPQGRKFCSETGIKWMLMEAQAA